MIKIAVNLRCLIKAELEEWLDFYQVNATTIEIIFTIILRSFDFRNDGKGDDFELAVYGLKSRMLEAICKKRFIKKRPEDLRCQINIFLEYCKTCSFQPPAWFNKKVGIFKPAWRVFPRYGFL